MFDYGTEKSLSVLIKFHSQEVNQGYQFSILNPFGRKRLVLSFVVRLEAKGALVGIVLCLLGFVIFIFGISNMTTINAASNSFLVVMGIFLGIAGLLVLIINVFSSGSVFT